MNIKIEPGAKVQITDKPIINVFGDVVQRKEVHIHSEGERHNCEDAEFVEEDVVDNAEPKGEGHIDDAVSLQLEIFVFKKNHNGKRIDFKTLHEIIDVTFVAEIKYQYEWLSLWRILFDIKLLEDTTLTSFTEQMNKWYPNAKKPCNADSMGDYFNPYLGLTSFVLWNEKDFMNNKTAKQSISGYRKLYNHCQNLRDKLKIIPVIVEK